MRRLIHGLGNAAKLAASITSTVGLLRRSVIVMSTISILPRPRCSNVTFDLVRTRASERAIASSTWRKHMDGPMCAPRTMARRAKRDRASRHRQRRRTRLHAPTYSRLRAPSSASHHLFQVVAASTILLMAPSRRRKNMAHSRLLTHLS